MTDQEMDTHQQMKELNDGFWRLIEDHNIDPEVFYYNTIHFIALLVATTTDSDKERHEITEELVSTLRSEVERFAIENATQSFHTQ